MSARSYETAFLSTRQAVAAEIDELGHVNNAVYVSWIQDAAVGHWGAITGGALDDAFVWVSWRHEIDYRQPVLEGETVEVRTWLGAWSGAKMDRYVDIRKPGQPRFSVASKTTWVLLDRKTRRPRKVNSDILTAFELT